MIDFRDLSRRNKKLKKLPSNVTLSLRPIEDDAREATIVLYRGSTAVVQACSFGAIPVYLENIGEISIDPFYDFNLVKIKIRSVKDFANILSSDNVPSISQKKHLIEYCCSFFTDLDPDAIDIKNIPLKK